MGFLSPPDPYVHMNPVPRQGETLGEYIDRVIVGEKPRLRHEWLCPAAALHVFEPSYVFAPYYPITHVSLATRQLTGVR